MSSLFISTYQKTKSSAAYTVHNHLGFGFLESVYEKALSIELNRIGIAHETQSPVAVYYHDHLVGDFVCDMLVKKSLILELNSVTKIVVAHEVQLVNYLNATKIDVGLLINFGPSKVELKRKYRIAKPDKFRSDGQVDRSLV